MKKKHYLHRNTMFKTLLFVLILIKNRHNSNLNHKKKQGKGWIEKPSLPNKQIFIYIISKSTSSQASYSETLLEQNTHLEFDYSNLIPHIHLHTYFYKQSLL